MTENFDIWCARGGGEGAMLLLLHRLGANATVWDGLLPILEANWQGAWLAPDLRGHGRSAHKPPYGMGSYAADPRINDVSRMDFKGMVGLARAPIHLLCGDQDQVGTPDSMADLGHSVTTLEGLGLYPQIQAPDVFWKAVEGGL